MKLKVAFSLLVAVVSAYGQGTEGSNRDSGDIMDFLRQSQIVEFRPNFSRDPFTTPSDGSSNRQGLMIDEITIKGRVVVRKKSYAIILDADLQAREIPIGFKFRDGEVTAITENAVVFTQWDPNSSNRSGSRTVTKFFKREEE